MAGTLEIPTIGSLNSTQDPKVKKAIEVLNGLLNSENKISAVETPLLTWYTPKVIATEQSTSSTSYTYLTSEDKIEGVVVPENGKVVVTYLAAWKSSVESAGRAALFAGSNIVVGTRSQPEAVALTSFLALSTSFDATYQPLVSGASLTSVPTTGIAIPSVDVYLPAGTYTIGVKYRATSGSVTAKERKLWVEVHG